MHAAAAEVGPYEPAAHARHEPPPFVAVPAEQAAQVASMADGVVVGSAIVKLIEKNGSAPDLAAQVEAFVKPLVAAVKALP
jgi:pyridoxal biosynthesis lyase PdxS